jgi:hypothetical protein
MKKTWLILLVAIAPALASGQALVDTSKKWNTMVHSEMGFIVSSDLIRFGGDTTLGTILYKKVLRATDANGTGWYPYGMIRETMDQKVYYRTDTSAQEYLFYDFGAATGDTLLIGSLMSWNSGVNVYLETVPVVVLSVDSMLIGSQYRKRWNLGYEGMGWPTDAWVEGMGSMAGVLHENFGFVGGDYHELLCYYQADTLVYLDPDYSDCIVISSDRTELPGGCAITVNPNPVTGISTVSVTGACSGKTYWLDVFSSRGTLVRSGPAGNGTGIRAGDFTPGLWLFRFTDEGRTVTTLRVIIGL